MAHRGKADGVQVNCIHPSFVETNRQWRRIKAEMERTGEPEAAVRHKITSEAGIIRFGTVEDVADLVAFLVSSRSSWMHGATIDLDGGEIPVGVNILLTPARIGAGRDQEPHRHAADDDALADEEGFVTDDTIAYYMARVARRRRPHHLRDGGARARRAASPPRARHL